MILRSRTANAVPDPRQRGIRKKSGEQTEPCFKRLGNRACLSALDMGNVSLALPSIHPMIGINSLPAVNHQPEFAVHCITADADKALADGALAMAWTCIDLATDLEIRDRLINRQ